ncbi:MAG: T9SS type A sorting domain-containing protein [Chlorobi bacterium]|nr:T9SS type A sorting domain-containing protein [Chlorobiota bacterium]
MSESGLFQNAPNPFQNDTEIKYKLAFDVQEAVLYVYDLQGKEIKSYRLTGNGLGNVIIKGNELEPGMYIYSLVVDKQLIDTKRMIITR